MPIRQLTQVEINRIAAGEVIERPASAVKELVENAIDAGATSIEIVAQNGGLSLLRVTDDGCGMDEADLSLCVERHATSKLPAANLQDIRTLGFRGEALPSLGSVAGLRIVTRPAGHNRGFEISVESGKKSGVRPAAARPGTCVEIRDLFAATPARLKFTKSERSENAAITDVVKRLALACPHIGFALTVGERASLALACAPPQDENAVRHRLARIMGRDFAEGSEAVRLERDGVSLSGFAGRPTLNRPDASLQYLFVNGRPVKDRLLLSAIRGAYQDLVPRGRYPLVALFLEIPVEDLDVNVHPAKAEVRFREASLVRSLVVSALSQTLRSTGASAAPRPFRAPPPLPPRSKAACSNTARPFAWIGSLILIMAAPPTASQKKRPLPSSRPMERPKHRRMSGSGRRGRSCTRPTSFRKPPMASSSWISTPLTSASSMRSSKRRLREAASRGSFCSFPRSWRWPRRTPSLSWSIATSSPRAASCWRASAQAP